MEANRETVTRILRQQLQEAMERRRLAASAFQQVTDGPTGLPSPDGAQSVINAAKAYTVALQDVTKAVKRRSAYIVTGIPPDDLRPEDLRKVEK